MSSINVTNIKHPSSASNNIVLDASARVGIGTASPGQSLDVNGNIRVGSNQRVMFGPSGFEAGIKYASNGAFQIAARAGEVITFNGGEDGTERARLDSSGRLGIGTTSPQNNVHINGSNAGLLITGSTNTSGLSMGVREDGQDVQIINNANGGMRFLTNTTERMRIGSSGGIDVSATGNADNYLRNTAGQTTASGANLFIDSNNGVLRRSTSSIKYKTDVETLQDSYADEILKCRPVWYRSTSEYDNQQWGYWGFIAEEVAEVDPRLCFFKENEDGSLEPEGVQYDRFVPHLLNLIKRQQQAIEDLQAEVAALKAA